VTPPPYNQPPYPPAGDTDTASCTVTGIAPTPPIEVEFGDGTGSDYPGTAEDTYLRTDFEQNFSTNPDYICTYTWPTDTSANDIIMKWDLSAIPSTATVVDATLDLQLNDAGGDVVYDIPVYQIFNVNPVISSCTWFTYDGTNSWTGGATGGLNDINSTDPDDMTSVNLDVGTIYSWDVSRMVSNWVANPSTNYGMLLNADETSASNSWRYFTPTENSNPDNRPRLVVTYQP